MKYKLDLKELDNLENYIEILSNRNEIKKEILYRLFINLLNENYMQNNQDIKLKDLKKCMSIIAEEKKVKLKEVKKVYYYDQEAYKRYTYSNDYLINYGIYKTFGLKSIKYLSSKFLKEIGYNKDDLFKETNIIDNEKSQKILQLQYDGRIKEE